MKILEVVGLTCHVGTTAVLDALSFTLEEGEILALCGPAGARGRGRGGTAWPARRAPGGGVPAPGGGGGGDRPSPGPPPGGPACCSGPSRWAACRPTTGRPRPA